MTTTITPLMRQSVGSVCAVQGKHSTGYPVPVDTRRCRSSSDRAALHNTMQEPR